MENILVEKMAMTQGQMLDMTVEALVSDGRGLGRVDGLVVLALDALPGQRVRVCVDTVRRRMAEGHVTEVLEPSLWQVAPACPHSQCGGCDWQGLAYDQQLEWKTRMIKDALERLGHLENPALLPALASPEQWGCRNKMEFAFATPEGGGKAVLGLRRRQSHEVVEVTECRMQTPLTMQVLAVLRELVAPWNLPAWNSETRTGFWRFVVVREPRAGGCLVEMIVAPYGANAQGVGCNDKGAEGVGSRGKSGGSSSRSAGSGSEALAHAADEAFVKRIGKEVGQALRRALPQVTGFVLSQRVAWSDVAYGESMVHSEGQTVLSERIACEQGNLDLRVGPQSFFQVNTEAARLLYAEVARMLNLQGSEVLWDLFCGVGSIGLSLAMGPHAPGKVYGVETLNRAVEMARANARAAGLENCHFETGDARTAAKRFPQPQAVVVDPPRAGLHEHVVADLLRTAPEKLVYVSCNPASLARDAALLSRRFALVEVRPIDLFPQTPHVECVALFHLR